MCFYMLHLMFNWIIWPFTLLLLLCLQVLSSYSPISEADNTPLPPHNCALFLHVPFFPTMHFLFLPCGQGRKGDVHVGTSSYIQKPSFYRRAVLYSAWCRQRSLRLFCGDVWWYFLMPVTKLWSIQDFVFFLFLFLFDCWAQACLIFAVAF